MIEAIEQTTCKDCGNLLVQSARKTPYPRAFCDATCRQRYHRKQTRASIVTPLPVTMNEQDYQARIAALEEEIQTLKALQGKRTRGRERAGLQHRLMTAGQATGYQSLTIRIGIEQGVDAYRAFAKDASEDMLARAIVAAGGS